MQQAKFYKKLEKSKVQCSLCPRKCVINKGGIGFCRARKNENGVLYSLVYCKLTGIQVDPVEKKPLYHFLPGSAAFSIGTAGCNLVCQQCQNWMTSQADPSKWRSLEMSPEEVVQKALEEHCESIAYTYNEPTIFYEFMYDTAKLAHQKGLKNIMVTNGFIAAEPLRELCKYIDAANVDLKSFDNDFYKKYAGAWIEPVLETLRILKEKKVWIEITTLIIPTLNDDMEKIRLMCKWIKANLGADVPLHFTAFYPAYKLEDLPPTNAATLLEARRIALDEGLNYSYVGNVVVDEAENTYCPVCKKLLIERAYFNVLNNNLKQGACCTKIAGVWKTI